MVFRQRSHVGHPSPSDIELVDELLGNIAHKLVPLQERLNDHKGKKAETGLKAFVGYTLSSELAGNRSTTSATTAVAMALPIEVRRRWGDTSPQQSYKRLNTMLRRISKVLAETDTGFDEFATGLFEAQLDASGIDFGDAVAFDGTVTRSAARVHYREPTKQEKAANRKLGRNPNKKVAWGKDADARHGHYPAKEGQVPFAFGYEAHIACPIPTVEGQEMPVVAAALAFQPNSTTDRPAIRDLLIARDRYKTVVFDAGYDYKGESNFQKFLDVGIAPIFDPRQQLRKGITSSHGKIIRDGDEFCPSTPEALRELPTLAEHMSEADRTALEAKYDERAKYMMARVSYGDGRVRSMCPAMAGKVVCPARPKSMKIQDPTAPEVTPPTDLPKCCVQKTTSTRVELLRRSRQGRHAYGTTEWGRIYRRRNRTESFNALIKHNLGNLAERSWSRVFGRCKVGLLFALKMMAANIRSIDNFLYDRQ